MFINELRKLVSQRIVLIGAGILLVANCLLVYINEVMDADSAQPTCAQYKALWSDLEEMSPDEICSYLSEKEAYMDAITGAYIYASFGYTKEDEEMFGEEFPEYSLSECVEQIKDGSYLSYTENFIAESTLYEDVLYEVNQTTGYESFLQETTDNILSMARKISDQNSYQYNNLAKSYSAYTKMTGTVTSVGPSKGLKLVCSYAGTDLCALAFILICCVCLVTIERENGMLFLLRSAKCGRKRLGAVKGLTLVAACLWAVVINGSTILMAGALYGYGDLFRSVQSVEGFNNCVLRVNLLGFLALFLTAKLLAYVMCACVIFAVCAFFRRSSQVYFGVAIITAVSCLVNTVSSTSWLVILKKLFPLGLLDAADILGKYENIRLGSQAVSRLGLSAVIVTAVLILAFALGVLAFARPEGGKESRRLLSGVLNRLGAGRHTNAFAHECYKFFIMNRGLAVLILAVICAWVMYEPEEPVTAGIEEELYYKSFIQTVEGPAEDVDDDYWVKLREYYTQKASEEDADLSGLSYVFYALDSAEKYGSYLAEHEKSSYVYNLGFNILTGADESYRDSQNLSAAFVMAFGILCFTILFAPDYQDNTDFLLRTTRGGRARLALYKLLTGLFCCVVIFLMAWSGQLLYVLKTFGTAGIDAKAYSLMNLSYVPSFISIRAYLIMLYALRFLSVVILMLLCLFLCRMQKSFMISALTAASVTLLPLGLAVLGADFMYCAGLLPLVLGNDLLSGFALFRG